MKLVARVTEKCLLSVLSGVHIKGHTKLSEISGCPY